MEAGRVKRATAGFVLSLIGGIFILINGLLIALFATVAVIPLRMVGMHAISRLIALHVFMLIVVGLICGVLVVIGAVLIYVPGKEVLGGILVLIFSILSIVIGGGFLIGMILGIIGGALGIAKK